MEEKRDSSHANAEENLIEIRKILKKIWLGRIFIQKVILLFFVVGCLFAFLSPVRYTSETTFVPQTSDQSSNNEKGYAQLASLAGITLNSESSSSLDNYISPLLYKEIIESDEFSISLIKEEITSLDGKKFTIKDYLNKDSAKFSLIKFLKKYTLDLIFNKNENGIISKELNNAYNFISNEDYNLGKIFKQKFSIILYNEEGYIKVIATDEDAFVSAQIVKLVTKNLQSNIIALRTSKIKEEVNFSKEQYESKREEFEILQNKLAKFRDSNKNISTAVFKADLQKLEAEYQIQNNILISLASEYNNNKIKLNKDTPIFSVLDEVSVPNKRSGPIRSIIILLFLFIGTLSSIGYVLLKDYVVETFYFITAND